jgi:hypothetical protein
MKECDPAVTDPAPGLLVDQPEPAGAALLEHLGDVRAAIGRVVEPGAALGEEAPDRSFLAEWPKQLDMGIADSEEHRLDALLGNGLAVLQRHAKALRIELDCRIEILDGDAEMVDCLKHGEAV